MKPQKRKSRSVLELLLLAAASCGIVLIFVWVGSANAAFQVGIADPGAGTIPSADVSALGLAAERRTVEWHGEASFAGRVNWTPGLRHFLAVSGGYPSNIAPVTESERQSYCGFVVSILRRYSSVRDVIVWNEPNLGNFWGAGVDAYVDLLASCSSIIRSAGARIWAPGMSPSTMPGVIDFARAIAKRGKHLIDGWDQHDYSAGSLSEKIAAVRAAFGWRVPLMVGETGSVDAAGASYLMRKAYCSGASGWMNFKLRDNGDWKPTGLRREDGSRKPTYAAVQAQASLIRNGLETCSGGKLPPPPPAPHWTPDQRRAQQLGEVGGWTRDAYEATR